MTTQDTHSILVAARNLIDREGWGQGDYRPVGGGYCIEGACHAASGGAFWDDPDKMWVHVSAVFRRLGVAVPFVWNDEPGRTKAEVLALFDKAIQETAPPPDVGFLEGRASFRQPEAEKALA